jgi:hypothetical protein
MMMSLKHQPHPLAQRIPFPKNPSLALGSIKGMVMLIEHMDGFDALHNLMGCHAAAKQSQIIWFIGRQ